MNRLRLGILQVNHDKSIEIGDKFPDDAHRFRDLFDALDDVRFSYRVYMTIGGEVPQDINEQDAYLITGSPLSVLDDLDWLPALYDFVRRCDQAKKPLLGACFGHQAIAVALGGKVERANVGWNVGVESCRFTHRKAWMTPHVSEMPLYVFHQDQVTQLPDGAELLGGSHKCPNASFAIGDHIFTTQAHPEFSEPFIRAVIDFTQQYFAVEEHRAILESLNQGQMGAVFAQWAANFFQGGHRS